MAKAFPNTGVTIIDSSSDLPAASAALEGVMMFQKDTNELKICDGSNWRSVIDTDTPPALQLVSSGSFSTSTGVNVDNVFSSSFINYRLLINITAASGGGVLNFYMRNNTTSITSDYQWQGLTSVGSSSPVSTNGNGSSGFLGYSGYFNGEWGICAADIFSPFEAKWTKTISSGNGVDSGGAGAFFTGSTHHKLATSYNGILFFIPSQNITGTYKLYGYRD